MPYLTAGETRLFYAAHGPVSHGERNLILIHGAGSNRLQWPAALRRLPGTSACVLDLPGHGRSPGPGYSSVEEYARCVEDFVRQLGARNTIVVGHSMGGAIALILALRNPEWLEKVVVIAASAKFRTMGKLLKCLDLSPDAVKAAKPALDEITSRAFGPTASSQMVRVAYQQVLHTDTAVVLKDLQACQAYDLTGEISCNVPPVLLISGSLDRIVPTEESQLLRDRIPGAQLLEIENAGHMPMLEYPGLVATAVRNFIDQDQEDDRHLRDVANQ